MANGAMRLTVAINSRVSTMNRAVRANSMPVLSNDSRLPARAPSSEPSSHQPWLSRLTRNATAGSRVSARELSRE